MQPTTPILMTIFVFTFIPLLLAEIARKKALPTLSDFFLQSRNMPAFTTFFTVYATWISIFAFLGASGYFYARGPVYMTTIAWDALFGLLFYVIGERVWAYGKLNGYITPSDFFDDIFKSRLLNALVTFIMLTFTVVYLQIQFSGGAYLIEIASGGLVPWEICGLLFYLIIVIYLWAGGLRAVAFTDVFYGALLFGSMIYSGVYLIEKAGGVAHVFDRIARINPSYVTLPGPSGDAGALLWLCMFVTVPIGALMGPQLWVRMYAVGKRKTFALMPLLLSLASIQCVGTLFAGSACILLKEDVSDLDKVVPLTLLEHADPLLCAVLFCGIASAALSTANSQIHAASAIYTIDIHRRFFRSNTSERHLVTVAKWAVLGISAAAYLLLLRSPSLIISTGTAALGGTAQVIVPTLGALFWERSHPKAAGLGLAAGLFTLILLLFCSHLEPVYITVIALMLNGGVFACLSLAFKPDEKTRSKIAGYKDAYQNKRR